jgi:hypothetical protein
VDSEVVEDVEVVSVVEEVEGEVFVCETPGCGFEHTYEGAGLSFCTDMSWPYRMLFFIETRMGRDK